VAATSATFEELLNRSYVSAAHLEMRDGYSRKDPAFIAWQAGEPIDPAAYWPQWFQLVRPVAARGVAVQRARIVSEPVSEYIRFERK
jgi:hypothetical protein